MQRGDTLYLDLAVAKPGPAVAVDVYFGILAPAAAGPTLGCPGGDAVLLFQDTAVMSTPVCLGAFPAGFQAFLSSVSIPTGLPAIMIPSFFTFTWPPELRAGLYTFFMALTPPGAFADAHVDAGDILSAGTDAVTR